MFCIHISKASQWFFLNNRSCDIQANYIKSTQGTLDKTLCDSLGQVGVVFQPAFDGRKVSLLRSVVNRWTSHQLPVLISAATCELATTCSTGASLLQKTPLIIQTASVTLYLP